MFKDVQMWLESLFINSVDPATVCSILDSAYETTDQNYGEAEALAWANSFKFPTNILEFYQNLFIHYNFNLHDLIVHVKNQISSTRISSESVQSALSPDNPDVGLVLQLVRGMPILHDPEFKHNGPDAIPKLSATYRRLSPTVNKILYEDFIDKKLAFILPKHLVVEHVSQFHLSKLSWTTKVGKTKGRPLLDCSAGVHPINSLHTKLECDKQWGPINHPTISCLVKMIINFWNDVKMSNDNVKWEDLTLWKLDLKGAFTLLSFEDSAVKFMSAEMSGDLIIFFICGVFGWTGTPSCFNVMSRVLKFEINKRIKGVINIYVDDAFGVSLKHEVDHDVEIASNFCKALFQSDCIEDSKTIINRRVDVIGYTIDLDLKLVSVTTKNFLRVVYGLSAINLDEKIPIKTLQKFSSWISRYSFICPILKPFIKNLYNSYSGFGDYVKIYLDEVTITTIRIFRSIFILSMIDEVKWTRSLDSFILTKPQFLIEFDGCLIGGGIIIYKINEDDGEELLGTSSINLSILNFGTDSSFQNTCEAIAAVVGLLIISLFCNNGASIAFRGDSMSALTWLQRGKFKSNNLTRVAVLFVYLCLNHSYIIGESVFITSEMNHRADFLSRNPNSSDQSVSFDYEPIIKILNPHLTMSEDEDFITLWNNIPSAVSYTLASAKYHQVN